MTNVNSFDIFDTLIARTVQNPTDIFDIIEATYPYKNYKMLRIQAQNNSNHTIENIYHNFQLLTEDDDETIANLRFFEIVTEISKVNNQRRT